MFSWLKRLSIRTQIFLLAMAIMLPLAGLLAWQLGAELRHAREMAQSRVRSIADNAATDLQRHFAQAEAALARIAARPLVRGLNPARCDPIVQEFTQLHPEFLALGLRDREGKALCTLLPGLPDASQARRLPWFERALRSEKPAVSDGFLGPSTQRWVSVMAYPVRGESGAVRGMLILPVDLLKLGELVFDGAPSSAIVTVRDRNKTIVLRSASAAAFVGKQAPGQAEEATRGLREGFVSSSGLDGVARLYYFQTVPGLEWRVVAGLPEDEIYAEYNATLRRTVVAWLGVLLLALGFAWRLGIAVSRPISDLAATAARVAAGDRKARALLSGPSDIDAVERQFNLMLDERNRAEAESREIAQRLEIALESSQISVWEVDYATGSAWLDARWAVMLGLPPGDTHTDLAALRSLVHPDDQQLIDAAAMRTLKGETSGYSVDHRVMAADGEWRWIQSRARVIERDAAGRALRVTGTNTDVTARVQAEEILRQERGRTRNYLDVIETMVVALNAQGNIVTINRKGCQILGYTEQELVGRDWFSDCLPQPEGRDTVYPLFLRLMAGEFGDGTEYQENQVVTRSGERREIAWHNALLRDKQGRITGTLSAGDDITERKKSERALRESETRFRDLLQNVPSVAVQGYTLDGTLQYWNFASEQLYGYTAAEAVGRNMLELIVPPELRVEVGQALRDMAATGVPLDGAEMSLLRKDGSRVQVYSSSAVVTLPGQPPELFCIDIDLTALRQAEAARASLEAQLRESQKMEAIGTLAGGIAHDFNNIIANILGNAELARQDASANPLAVQSLEEIRKAGARARDLVQQILSFSRRQPTERKRVALMPIIEEAVRLLRATLPPRVALDVSCAGELPEVLADATQIEQVVLNLATNAMQAMRSAPGHIQILVDAVVLDAALAAAHPALTELHKSHPGTTVRLLMKDSGVGMDAATLERVFEPFFTTKPVDEGTGLGLSVVHGIVQSHEGAITVQSRPGEGAVFTIYLPVAGAAAARMPEAAVPPAVAAADAGGLRLMYIDDDDALVFLVKRLLERRGYRVRGYTHQNEALAVLRDDPGVVDMVLSDYNMPGMSGLDLARAIRDIRADLPVAIASGFIDETLRAEAGGAGVCELIFKATAVDEFCEAVQRLARTVGKTVELS
jgi:PAS domain S-box-containing protein